MGPWVQRGYRGSGGDGRGPWVHGSMGPREADDEEGDRRGGVSVVRRRRRERAEETGVV